MRKFLSIFIILASLSGLIAEDMAVDYSDNSLNLSQNASKSIDNNFPCSENCPVNHEQERHTCHFGHCPYLGKQMINLTHDLHQNPLVPGYLFSKPVVYLDIPYRPPIA